MKHKKMIFILVLVILLASMAYGSAMANESTITEDEELVVWDITQSTVIDEGQTVVLKQGMLTSGFTIEAKAKSKHKNVVPEGTLVITLNAFKPAREMPGQVPGTWYISGDWVITKKNASEESAEARHSVDKASGTIMTELDFNPLTSPGNWTALARVPMSPTAGRWSMGQGSLTMDEKFEGQLTFELIRLAEIE